MLFEFFLRSHFLISSFLTSVVNLLVKSFAVFTTLRLTILTDITRYVGHNKTVLYAKHQINLNDMN